MVFLHVEFIKNLNLLNHGNQVVQMIFSNLLFLSFILYLFFILLFLFILYLFISFIPYLLFILYFLSQQSKLYL